MGNRVRLCRRAGWVAMYVKSAGNIGTPIEGYKSYPLGTIPEGWRPQEQVAAPVTIQSPPTGAAAYLMVGPSGVAYVQNWSPATIASDLVAVAMWPLP